MKVAHIAPNDLIETATQFSDIDMILAHKVLEDDKYTRLFKKSRNYRLLDNSFYELNKSLSSREILEAAGKVTADGVILRDGTLDNIDEFKYYYLDVMAVPVDFKQLLEFYQNPKVDKIGISSLHMSKYLGVDLLVPGYRYEILKKLKSEVTNYNPNRIHLLGAVNFVLKEVQQVKGLAGSIDTSAACWTAINGISLEPDTLKLKTKVDFNVVVGPEAKELAIRNMTKFNQTLES